eukprot:TRINITY_DN10694_c0_g1_i1.p1 TRINITY_DN10694_c0_g1~~TRINITY_DN10694_c0_g1_i1.p1  ORF type:complete len:520 (+),score=187.11 TRINITY_DN10694_c0_g1_i1:1226-2785(+)
MAWGSASLEALRAELRNVSVKHGYQKWQTQDNLKRVLVREGERLDMENKEKARDGLCTMLAVLIRLADEANIDLVKGMEDKLGSRLDRVHKGERPAPLDSDSLDKLEKDKQQTDNSATKSRPAFKRTLSVVCDSRDPTMLYSPTHFCHDLFSPVTSKKDFDVEYNSRQPLLPTSLSKQSLLQTQNSESDVPNSPLSPQSLEHFYPMVEALETTAFSEEELKSLDLTFCAPHKGKIVDLVEGGVMRPVTKDTFQLFVKLAKQLAAEGEKFTPKPWEEVTGGPFAAAAAAAASKSNGGPKRMKRTLSVTPLVGKWERDEGPVACFSPTHFAHDLFSPVTNKTDFDIDYSEQGAAKTLPASLSKGNLHNQLPSMPKSSLQTSPQGNTLTTVSPRSPGKRLTPVQSMRRPSVASFGSEEEEEYKGLDLLCEVAEEKQKEQAMKSKLDLDQGFLPVIEEVEGMLENNEITEADLREMDLTFCIPANGQLHELFPNGKETHVTLERLPEFIRLAKIKKREIESTL